MLNPAGVRVGNESITGLELRRDGADACDVRLRIAADFELKTAVTLSPIFGHPGGHLLRRLLRYGAIQVDVFPVAAAQQFADGQAGRLAEDVPARDVDPTLNVGMALEHGIHAPV